jgi:hypothetical protein
MYAMKVGNENGKEIYCSLLALSLLIFAVDIESKSNCSYILKTSSF